MDPEATYKFVDIIEVPTDEIEEETTENDDIMASVNDANWPDDLYFTVALVVSVSSCCGKSSVVTTCGA